MLLTHFVIGKLYSGITIFLYCTDLRDYAWTSLNDGAWIFFPSAPKTEVIPIFFPINPGIGLLINCLSITYPPQYIFAGCKYTINFLIFNILEKHFSESQRTEQGQRRDIPGREGGCIYLVAATDLYTAAGGDHFTCPPAAMSKIFVRPAVSSQSWR